jgi:hypothetical protein
MHRACFTDRTDGAIVNASRSLTYFQSHEPASEEELAATIRATGERMGRDLADGLADEGLPHPHRKTTDHGTLRTGRGSLRALSARWASDDRICAPTH